MTDEFKIRNISNGAILKVKSEEGVWTEESFHFDKDNPEGAIELVWGILQELGLFFGKHDAKVFNVSIRHGAGYECKGCEICRKTGCVGD